MHRITWQYLLVWLAMTLLGFEMIFVSREIGKLKIQAGDIDRRIEQLQTKRNVELGFYSDWNEYNRAGK